MPRSPSTATNLQAGDDGVRSLEVRGRDELGGACLDLGGEVVKVRAWARTKSAIAREISVEARRRSDAWEEGAAAGTAGTVLRTEAIARPPDHLRRCSCCRLDGLFDLLPLRSPKERRATKR
eukprot:SAG11_NODE_777_length_7218_cov_24.269420_6_plen_122_part_00